MTDEAARAREAPRLAIAAAALLVVLKGLGAWTTGSLALGSAALDSLIDVFVSAANYLVLRRSAAPPDEEHAYGHGRFEDLAALFQGVFLAGAAVSLVVAAAGRLVSGEAPRQTGVGMAVLAVSMVCSLMVARFLSRAAKRAESPALQADSLHYATDFWVNGAAVVALAVVGLTGWAPADPLVAIGVAIFVFKTAVGLVLDALGVLADRGLPEEELRRHPGHRGDLPAGGGGDARPEDPARRRPALHRAPPGDPARDELRGRPRADGAGAAGGGAGAAAEQGVRPRRPGVVFRKRT